MHTGQLLNNDLTDTALGRKHSAAVALNEVVRRAPRPTATELFAVGDWGAGVITEADCRQTVGVDPGSAGGSVTCTTWVYMRNAAPAAGRVPALAQQLAKIGEENAERKSGPPPIHVGDLVRVLPHPTGGLHRRPFIREMDRFIGRCGVVVEITASGSCDVLIHDGPRYFFPRSALQCPARDFLE